MTHRAWLTQRGVTLTEMMVVIVIAGLVILGMTTFYFNAQSVWLDGSSQAITQREATLVVDTIRDSMYRAVDVQVPQSDRLFMYSADDPLNSFFAVWLEPSDSLLHYGRDMTDDRGPLVQSRVARFEVADLDSLVELTILQLNTGTDQQVQVSSRFDMPNQL